MSKFFVIALLSAVFFSCQQRPPAFVSKSDTTVVAFKRLKGWNVPAFLYLGAYTTFQKKQYSDSPSVNVSYVTGYNWRVKISDTTPDGHGHALLDSLTHRPVAFWQPVPDSLAPYLTIIP